MKEIFDRYKDLSIAVFGDYCLDEYFWIDAAMNEPSLETGLVAYQCTKRETSPGAAGTVAKNLKNLGIGTVYAVGFVGDDGRGLELCKGLDKLNANREHLIITQDRATPAYTKPWLMENGKTEELNRIDIKNWTPTPAHLEDELIAQLKSVVGKVDALLIMDQVAETGCGVVTDKVRAAISEVAKQSSLLIYADSRDRIGLFEGIMVKGNQFELTHAIYGYADDGADTPVKLAADPTAQRTEKEIDHACETLFKKNNRPVICTMGELGARIYHDGPRIDIPAVEVKGQTDVTGGGDMFTAAFMSALAGGADKAVAGRAGNIAAAICVQQLGSSGYVTAEDILKQI